MYLLKITPLEPLVISKVKISSPDVISAHTVLETPPPTTILGVLGSMYGIWLKNKGQFYGLDSLFNKLLNKLKCSNIDKPIIKGVLLLYRDRLYIPVYSGLTTFFIPIDKLDKLHINSTNNIHYINMDDLGEYIVHKPITRIGISLKRPESKSVRHGYMYEYSASTYVYVKLECNRIGYEKVVAPSFIYLLDCELEEKASYLRVGGRGRIGVVEITSVSGIDPYREIVDRVKSIIELEEGEKGLLINPLPIITSDRNCIYTDCYNILDYLEIIGLVKIVRSVSEEEKIKQGIYRPLIKFIGLSLGYSEAFKVRRPILPAIPYGTMVRLKQEFNGLPKILNLLISIGYGSVLAL